MKKILLLLLLLPLVYISCGKEGLAKDPLQIPEPPRPNIFLIAGNTESTIEADNSTMLKNPCTGWCLYAEEDAAVGQQQYWIEQDRAARKYATHFYVRWPWIDMEPEEGKYAWIYNEEYKKMIQGALDRGLKLAFRVFDCGKDWNRQATPSYVEQAGADGVRDKWYGSAEYWTPYEDDPVFLAKLEKFIKAFAAEYDNPDIVDYVDGVNLDSWGECNGGAFVEDNTFEKKIEILEKVSSMYADNFKRVILVYNFDSGFTREQEDRVLVGQKGYAMRRDGVGSGWYLAGQKQHSKEVYGKIPIFGEACYFGSGESEKFPDFWEDSQYHYTTWRQCFEQTYKDAVEHNFNTLDLRQVADVKGWLKTAPDLVEKFVQIGGYRLAPSVVSAPQSAKAGRNIKIGHRWINSGVGFLPNNNKRWNFKYKVAVALIDVNGTVKNVVFEESLEPSAFLKDKPSDAITTISTEGLSAGEYSVAVAIVDGTKDNAPAILLATKARNVKGWSIVAKLNLTD